MDDIENVIGHILLEMDAIKEECPNSYKERHVTSMVKIDEDTGLTLTIKAGYDWED